MRRCDAVLGGSPPTCYGRNVDVWHGYTEPALACEKHVSIAIQRVFKGHRLRMAPEVAAVSEG